MFAAFGFIYSLLQAVPILNTWIQEFFIFYAKQQKEWTYEAISRGVTGAIRTGDQRELEHTIGSPRADQPSGHDGAEFDKPDSP